MHAKLKRHALICEQKRSTGAFHILRNCLTYIHQSRNGKEQMNVFTINSLTQILHLWLSQRDCKFGKCCFGKNDHDNKWVVIPTNKIKFSLNHSLSALQRSSCVQKPYDQAWDFIGKRYKENCHTFWHTVDLLPSSETFVSAQTWPKPLVRFPIHFYWTIFVMLMKEYPLFAHLTLSFSRRHWPQLVEEHEIEWRQINASTLKRCGEFRNEFTNTVCKTSIVRIECQQ